MKRCVAFTLSVIYYFLVCALTLGMGIVGIKIFEVPMNATLWQIMLHCLKVGLPFVVFLINAWLCVRLVNREEAEVEVVKE